MSKFACPECGFTAFDSDWFYNNNLYADEHECKVKCPHCDEEFMAKSYHAPIQEACSIEDYERFGGEFP